MEGGDPAVREIEPSWERRREWGGLGCAGGETHGARRSGGSGLPGAGGQKGIGSGCSPLSPSLQPPALTVPPHHQSKNQKKERAAAVQHAQQEFGTVPHSFVFHRGRVGKNVRQLIADMRKVMEPYTARALKVSWEGGKGSCPSPG